MLPFTRLWCLWCRRGRAFRGVKKTPRKKCSPTYLTKALTSQALYLLKNVCNKIWERCKVQLSDMAILSSI